MVGLDSVEPSIKERRDVVDDLAYWIAAWHGGSRNTGSLSGLVEQAEQLSHQASAAGYGGIARHLKEAATKLKAGAQAEAQPNLAALSDMLAQAKAELQAEKKPHAGASFAQEQSDELEPPPMLNVPPAKEPENAAASLAPPPAVASSAKPKPSEKRPLVDLGKSMFAVKSMFGLRPKAPPPASASKPPIVSKEPLLEVAEVPRVALSNQSPRPAPPPADLFGLAKRRAGKKATGKTGVLAPPPMVGQRDPMGLPPLAQRSKSEQLVGSDDIRKRLDSIKKGGPPPQGPRPTSAPRKKQPIQRGAKRAHSPVTRWVIVAIAGFGVVVVAVVAFIVLRDPAPVSPLEAKSTGPAGGAPSGPAAAPLPEGSALTFPEERFNELLRSVRGYGAKTSPELAALIDEQAGIAREVLRSDKCEDAEAKGCEGWKEIRNALVGDKPVYVEKRRRSTTRALWMEGLKLPKIPVSDDARVMKMFEFYTQNPRGREVIQKMIFRCGAYQDLIRSTLERLDMPLDLQALVFAESGCAAGARSPVGAAGLWQFMPATARAYHLKVEEDVVDERLNPHKSTQAGIRFLSHLYAKFGDWELVLASYNLGPFGVLSRVERAGGDAGFWELVDAGLLPDETANYVPTIEAIALILRNLRKLKFGGTQMRSPDLTADLEAPTGTRLSLVARAAATSAVELRRLNPDIVGEHVPNVNGGFAVQVPKDVVWQARDTLKELLAQNNRDDLCVPPNFDWGRKQFTPKMAKSCHKKLKVTQ